MSDPRPPDGATVPEAMLEAKPKAHRKFVPKKRASFDPFIRLPNGQSVQLSLIERDPASRAKFLGPFHGSEGGIQCLCRGDGVPMGVARREVPHLTFYLYPLHRADPARHARACPNGQGPAESLNAQEKPVVQTVRGRVRVNLASPVFALLRDARRADEEEEAREAETCAAALQDADKGSAAPRPGSPKGKLLTLLQLLWSEAELNVWRPAFASRRNYGVVATRLRQAARLVDVKTAELEPLLYVPPTYREDVAQKELCAGAFAQFVTTLKADMKGKRFFGFALGLLRKVERPRGHSVALSLAHAPRSIWTDADTWARVSRQRLGDLLEGDLKDTPIFVLLRVSREEGASGPWLKLHEMTGLRLADTRCWIPVGGEEYRRLLGVLLEQGRSFRKPLSALLEADRCVPDFVLEDRKDRTYLEVLHGMDDEAVRELVEERRAYYAELGQAVWWWDAETQPDVPPLPPPDL